ncbi:MAG: TlyA family RNA methyltransferase [SAR324 cluster bacterium]|nr:TlyA family RNA methyltransferase [SAR324 cluster bacterium]
MSSKIRLDKRLLSLGLAPDLTRARAYIWSGLVRIKGQINDKVGALVDESVDIDLQIKRFVTRGGLKLEEALLVNDIDLKGKVVLDVGVGHGGFSDCMLQRGAKKIYAVDVGPAFLVASLQKESKVVYYPKTNFRYATKKQIPEEVDFFCVDVSFISVKKILPVAVSFLKKGGGAVVLVKPQFEAAKNLVGSGGVIRSDRIQQEIIFDISESAKEYGLVAVNVIAASLCGKKKHNQEFLIYFKKEG